MTHDIKYVSVRIVVERDDGTTDEHRFGVDGRRVALLRTSKRICSLDWTEASADGGMGSIRLAVSRELVEPDDGAAAGRLGP